MILLSTPKNIRQPIHPRPVLTSLVHLHPKRLDLLPELFHVILEVRNGYLLTDRLNKPRPILSVVNPPRHDVCFVPLCILLESLSAHLWCPRLVRIVVDVEEDDAGVESVAEFFFDVFEC